MANFFDQFDGGPPDGGGAYIAPSGRLRVVITPPPENPKYADAISSVESGGNYRAIGPDTGGGNRALGKYQVMASNVGPWSKEILGQEITPQEFLANPQIQDKIFNAKFGAYAQKYGPEGAARAWFAGEGGMNDPNRKDVLGTTVADYGSRFMNAMGPTQANAAPASQPSAQPPQQGGGNFFDQFDAMPAQASQPDAMKELSDISSNALTPQVGTGRAALEGVLSGASGNFRDEIYGASAASGLPEIFGGFRAPVGAARLAYEAATGNGGQATDTYNSAVNRIREIQKAGEAQHPYATVAGNLAGAVALPVGGAASAATLPGRIAQGATLGAGLGAVYGFGGGENLPDRLRGAAGGAVLGGAVGGAAPVVVEGVTRGARAVGTGIANAVRGVTNPGDEAARRVAMALQRDIRLDPTAANRMTPGEFAANAQSGGPAAIMDIGGETTRALARSAANTSPEGRQVLNNVINDRFESQSGRLTEWLKKTFNFPDARATQDAIEKASSAINRPAYKLAYQQGQRIWDGELEQLAQAPEVQSAIRIASVQLKNWAVADGLKPPTNPFEIVNGITKLKTDIHGYGQVPSLQFWDYVKRALDKSNSPTSRQFAAALREHLDSLVPSYMAARQGAAQLFSAENALEAGQKFVTQNFANADAQRALAKFNPLERKLFQDGFVSRLIEQMNQSGDRRSILNAINSSPNAREKMAIVLGPQKYAELEAGLRVEGIMDLARSAIQGNSTTARQLAELGIAGGAYGLGTGGDILNPNPSALMNAALVYGLLRGKTRINENVSRKVAEMLASNDPTTLLRGIRVLTQNQKLFNSLRVFDSAFAKIGASRAPVPNGPALSAIGRADPENDQPSVPGPSGQ